MPIILALDLAVSKTGWIFGDAGTVPQAHTLRLRKGDDRPEEAVATLARWLRDKFEAQRPDLVAMEGLIPAGALRGMTTASTRDGQVMLHGCARAVAACYGIAVRAPPMGAIRTHFIGMRSAAPKRGKGHIKTAKESAADRAALKSLIVARAVLLGYLPRGSTDDNAADSAACWDYCSAHFFRRGVPFAMFGQESGT